MIKKIYSIFFILSLCMLFLVNCSSNSSGGGASTEGNKMQVIDVTELEKLLSEQPVSVIKTEYVVQDEEYKSLYPDMLRAVVSNNTDKDIKDIVLAFAAWDSNKLPVKIKASIDFTEGDYIKKVDYKGINLIPGGTFGEEEGYSIDHEGKIDMFKAIVVSYETFEGEKWENPHYKKFRDLYEGKKYSDNMSIEVR